MIATLQKRFFLLPLLLLMLIIVSYCFIGVGVSVAYADTPDTGINDDAALAAEKVNNEVERWVGVIVSALGVACSSGILALVAKNKKQTVSVNVNDQTTQQKLDLVLKEYMAMKEALNAAMLMQKGMLDVMSALYAENPNFDEAVRSILKKIDSEAQEIVGKATNTLKAERIEQIGDVIKNISLG